MNKPMHRRTLLKGLGVGIVLPMLECMQPARASEVEVPRRMLLISNNLGVLPGPFFPKQSGESYTLSPYLEELKDYRHEFTVFSGLSHPGVIGGHSTENCFLTAARGPTRSGFRNQVSLDQYAAETLGQKTRFATLNLGVNIDRANRSLAWTRDGALLPAEDSPSDLFRRLYFRGGQREIEGRLHELRLRGSILDTVLEDSQQLSRQLGKRDQARLDQYFTSIRELEQRLVLAGWWEQHPTPAPDRPSPIDIEDKSQFFEKFSLMLSMAQLALETDSTRIVTLMVDAYATPVFKIADTETSINDYHNLSHHGNVVQKVAQLEAVDRRQMRLLKHLLERFTNVEDGPARLLDNTMVLYGSNMGDSNTHDNTNLPILLAGGGFRHGQHLAYDVDNNRPLSNLFLSMLHRLKIPADKFGSSTGTLSELVPSG